MEKRGQMKMSFGMIFTIILIVMFLAFAFFGIKKFLGFQETIKTKQFLDDLQDEVDKLYGKGYGEKPVTYLLPSDLLKVCFVDMEENILLEFKGGPDQTTINHLDMEAILNGKDQVCATVENEKLQLNLKRGFRENLVTITF